jgi:Rad3-related DNA helicase
MRRIIAFVFLLVFLVSSSSAFAQSPLPSRSPRGIQVRQEVKERIQEERQERVAALSEKRQGLIRNYFQRMLDRFDAAIIRLEKLIERISSRVEKIKEEDPSQDLSDQEEQLSEAKNKLDEARDKKTMMIEEFETFLTSDEPTVVFKELGESIRDLKSDLVEVHTLLTHIIGDIKGLRVGLGKPTPTP